MMCISKEAARRYLIEYQELAAPRRLAGEEDIERFLGKVGCIQFDPLNKAGRNADLVLQSRVAGYTENTLYRMLYERRSLLDAWDKNMAIIPALDWPYLARTRQRFRERLAEREPQLREARAAILELLEERDSVSSKEIVNGEIVDSAWSPTGTGRAALEYMFACGELLVHHKKGTRKFYSLPERVLSPSLVNAPEPNGRWSDFCRWYVSRRVRSIGLVRGRGGDAWLGMPIGAEERFRVLRSLVDDGELTEVEVSGTPGSYFLPSDQLDKLESKTPLGEASIIAPLDNLIWDRSLVSALFDFDYRWEVYVPKQKRRYGYYVLPLLYGDRFVGRFEPVMDRKSGRLHIENWWWEADAAIDRDAAEALSRALRAFAAFLGAESLSFSDELSGTSHTRDDPSYPICDIILRAR